MKAMIIVGEEKEVCDSIDRRVVPQCLFAILDSRVPRKTNFCSVFVTRQHFLWLFRASVFSCGVREYSSSLPLVDHVALRLSSFVCVIVLRLCHLMPNLERDPRHSRPRSLCACGLRRCRARRGNKRGWCCALAATHMFGRRGVPDASNMCVKSGSERNNY